MTAHEYRLVEATTGQQALLEAATRSPDLVILDLGLPDLDGVEVTRRLREWSATPIIVISARGREDDKIQALDAGADDYLTKPFGVGELLARMRVAFRNAARVGSAGDPVFEIGDLRVDLAARRVLVGGAEVHLTRTQFNLLAALVKHSGKVMTHRELTARRVGAGGRGAVPLRTGLHGPAPAQAGGGSRPPAVPGDGDGSRLPASLGVTRSCGSHTGP